MLNWQTIDWSDLSAKISNHFTVHEATYLPSWGVHHSPSDQEKENICKMADLMDTVRDFLHAPVSIHVWIRPGSVNCPGSPHHGQDYNAFVKGATHSAHKTGQAVDWDCSESCDTTRTRLEPWLDHWGLRMERMPGGNWVHLDDAPVPPGGHRYFVP